MFEVVDLVGDEALLYDLAVGGDEPVRATLVRGVDLRFLQQSLAFEQVDVGRAGVGENFRPGLSDVTDAGEVPVRVTPQEDLGVAVVGGEHRHRRDLSGVLDRLVRADVPEQDLVVLGHQRGRLLVAGGRAPGADLQADTGGAERANHPVVVRVDRRVGSE